MSACASCGSPVSVWHAKCPVCGAPSTTVSSGDSEAGDEARHAARGRLEAAALADYEVVREIGRGGMGWVFLAKDRKLGRLAALKMLPALDAMRAASLERFRREAETAARLTHPNIVPIYGAGGDLATPYFAMAYIDGESLAERLIRESRLDIAEAVRIAREVGAALAYAHRQGVVHRDIKPANVLLERESGRALVTDFGVARGDTGGGLTQSGFAVGTPGYMSPEQAGGSSDVDARSDVYALGILLFEMVTGRRFDAVDQAEWPLSTSSIRRALTGSRPDVSAALAQAITRATAPKREDRFPTVEAMLAAVGGAVTPPAGSLTEPRGGLRAWWLVTAVVAAAVLGGLGWRMLRPSHGPAQPALPAGQAAIALLPFEGDPADAALLLRILSYQLESFPRVRVADARVFAPPRGATLASPEVRDLAIKAGARWVLWGIIVPVPAGTGREILVRAIDVRTGEFVQLGRATVASLSVGAADSIVVLVARSQVGRDLGLQPGAGSTTLSIEAVHAYDAAEEAFRRADYPTALREYGRVVQLDTAFALARYKRFLAAMQEEPSEPALREAVAEMRRVVSRVGPRESRLLGAYLVLFDSGDVAGAERQLRDLVAEDSTFLDGWFALGEVRYHFGALAGLPPDSAGAAFRHALALWPNAAPAIMHLIALDIFAGRDDSARANIERYLRLDSTSAVGLTVKLGSTVWFGSIPEKREVMARLASQDDRVLEFGAIMGGTLARGRLDLVNARLALEEMTRPTRPRATRSEGARFLVVSFLAEGRWSDAERERARLAATLPGDRDLALLPDIIRDLRSGMLEQDRDTARLMERYARQLAGLVAPRVPFGLVASQWQARWRLARLVLARGDTARALRLLEAQNFLSAFSDQAVRAPAWLLQGRIAAARGDRDAAVRYLRGAASLLYYAEPPWDALRDSARSELEKLDVQP